jgi:hypothetical protein
MKPNSSTTKKPPGVKIRGATPKFFEENEFNTMQIVSCSFGSRLTLFS